MSDQSVNTGNRSHPSAGLSVSSPKAIQFGLAGRSCHTSAIAIGVVRGWEKRLLASGYNLLREDSFLTSSLDQEKIQFENFDYSVIPLN